MRYEIVALTSGMGKQKEGSSLCLIKLLRVPVSSK